MGLSYREVYDARKAAGIAKQAPKGDKNTMTVEGAVDLSDGKMPKVPEKEGPTLPADDAFKKFRTSQA